MELFNKDTLSGVICGLDTLIPDSRRAANFKGNLSLLAYQAELLKTWHFQFTEIHANLFFGMDSHLPNFTVSFRFELVQTPQFGLNNTQPRLLIYAKFTELWIVSISC